MKDKKILEIKNLVMHFPLDSKNTVNALNGVSLDIFEGETVGIVGESGCGKTTLGRTLLQLYKPTSGQVLYHGRDIIDFAPSYFKKIIDNFISAEKQYQQLTKEKLALFDQAMQAKSEQEKEELLEKSEMVRQKGKIISTQNVPLAGGLILHSNQELVGQLLLAHYHKQHEYFKKEHQLNELNKKNNRKATNELQTKIIAKEKEMATLTKGLNQIRDQLRQLQAEVKSDPNFEKLEARKEFCIDLGQLTKSELNVLRKDLQIIFQDPYSALNPRMTVRDIIKEGMLATKMYSDRKDRYDTKVDELLEKVGLKPMHASRFPHEFSGGQRQRIGIARVLAVKPKVIVCDEPTSALDVSIQAQVINLLKDLQAEFNLTYLFISHDLSIVRHVSDKIAIMYLGKIVEIASTDEIYDHPMHPYTKALLSAIPIPDYDIERARQRIAIEGDLPNPINLKMEGCAFYPRCSYRSDECLTMHAELKEVRKNHFTTCVRAYEEKEGN